MKWVKPRKPRGRKLDGRRSQDMCPCCIAFNCDPFSMSSAFRNKVDKRREQGLCSACGGNPCKCKSKSGLKKPIMMFKKTQIAPIPIKRYDEDEDEE